VSPIRRWDLTVQEQNKAKVKRILSEGDDHELGFFDEMCASDYKMYMPSNGEPINLAEHKTLWQAFIDGFPDLNHTIDHAIAEGEYVATRETLRGTNNGEFQGRPPTGKSVEFNCTCLWRFVDGKLVEYRTDADLLGMNEQLGMELTPKDETPSPSA
jgi:predicted ester cyclase